MGANAGFIAFYEQGMSFAARMHADPREAYRVSKEFRNKGKEPYRSLARTLRLIAAKADVPERRFDFARKILKEGDRGGVALMHDFATQLYSPAVRELANVYLKGIVVNKDTARAYYWIHRAEKNGIDMKMVYPSGSTALFDVLTDEEKFQLRLWKQRDIVPPPNFF